MVNSITLNSTDAVVNMFSLFEGKETHDLISYEDLLYDFG